MQRGKTIACILLGLLAKLHQIRASDLTHTQACAHTYLFLMDCNSKVRACLCPFISLLILGFRHILHINNL